MQLHALGRSSAAHTLCLHSAGGAVAGGTPTHARAQDSACCVAARIVALAGSSLSRSPSCEGVCRSASSLGCAMLPAAAARADSVRGVCHGQRSSPAKRLARSRPAVTTPRCLRLQAKLELEDAVEKGNSSAASAPSGGAFAGPAPPPAPAQPPAAGAAASNKSVIGAARAAAASGTVKGVVGATAHIVTAVVGSGVLALPYSVAVLGS